jgi:hypothetical protein
VLRFWTYSFVLAVRILKGLVHAMVAKLCGAKNRLWFYVKYRYRRRNRSPARYGEDIPS